MIHRILGPLLAVAAFAGVAGNVLAQAPGNFSTNLRVWYKADANAYSATGPLVPCANNSTVRQWNDQTANALNLSQSTSGQRPTWLDGSASTYFNYNPSIKFTDHFLQRAAPGILVNGTIYTKVNLYLVYYDYDAGNFDWLLYTSGVNGFNRLSVSMNYGGASEVDSDVGPLSLNRVNANTTTDLPPNRMNFSALKFDATGLYGGGELIKIQQFANGNAMSPTLPFPLGLVGSLLAIAPGSYLAGNYATYVGDNESGADGNNSPFTGELGEMIMYTGSVNQANHQRIESYLALKYSAPLYGHDYFNSAGTTMFVNSGSYVNSVIGFARDDNQGLYQKQSRQSDDTTRVFIGTLASTNAANASTISTNLASVMVGHNAGKMRTAAATNSEIPSGQGIYSRIDREWKVTNAGFTGSFSLAFKLNTAPITATDLRLLVDDDGNFTNASSNGTPQGLTITYAAGVVTVSGISNTLIPANSSKYVTIASTSLGTPLPVEMLYFNAELAPPAEVATSWATATELHNDHFDVERSRDGIVFEKIGELAGQGTTQVMHTYSFFDRTPYSGSNYYRLKQVDTDGTSDYSEVKEVTVEKESSWTIYPNPAHDIVRIAGLGEAINDLVIFDMGGRPIPLPPGDANDGSIDVSPLPKGIYFARIGDQVARIVKE